MAGQKQQSLHFRNKTSPQAQVALKSWSILELLCEKNPFLLNRNISRFHLNVYFEKKAISTMPLLCCQRDAIKPLKKIHLYCCLFLGNTLLHPGKQTEVFLNDRDFSQVTVLLYHILTKCAGLNALVAQYFVLNMDAKKSESCIAFNCSSVIQQTQQGLFWCLVLFCFVINILQSLKFLFNILFIICLPRKPPFLPASLWISFHAYLTFQKKTLEQNILTSLLIKDVSASTK